MQFRLALIVLIRFNVWLTCLHQLANLPLDLSGGEGRLKRRCCNNLTGCIDNLRIMQLTISDDHLLRLMSCCCDNLLCGWLLCRRLLYCYICMLHMIMDVVFHHLMRLCRMDFHLSDRLFNNHSNAFDVLPQLFVGIFNTLFECMASTHLMHTLNTNLVRPSVSVIKLQPIEMFLLPNIHIERLCAFCVFLGLYLYSGAFHQHFSDHFTE